MIAQHMPEPRIIRINGVPHVIEGQGRGKAYEQNPLKPYRPPETKYNIERRIYDVVYAADRAMTCKEIAAALGLSKRWVQTNLDVLIANGDLVRYGVDHNGLVKKYFYEVAR